MAELILSKNFEVRDAHTLRVYRETGGYRAGTRPRGWSRPPSPRR